MKSMCGEGAVIDTTCQKWFVKFCAGDFSLGNNAPWSGRPVEVDSDPIETLRTINVTTWETADILKISKSIKVLVTMKNVSVILREKNPCGLFFSFFF